MVDHIRRRRPLVGITADIEWREGIRPIRTHCDPDAHLSRAVHAAGATVVIVPYDDDDPHLWCDRLDGIVITGGASVFPRPQLTEDDAFELEKSRPRHKVRQARFESALAIAAIERDLPLLGIFGGFQILNRVANGQHVVDLTTVHSSWSTHVQSVRGKPPRRVTPARGTALETLVGFKSFAVSSQTEREVLEVANRARVAAWSDDGLVEAIEIPGLRFCIAVQWDPEFCFCAHDAALLDAFVHECSESVVAMQPGSSACLPDRQSLPLPFADRPADWVYARARPDRLDP